MTAWWLRSVCTAGGCWCVILSNWTGLKPRGRCNSAVTQVNYAFVIECLWSKRLEERHIAKGDDNQHRCAVTASNSPSSGGCCSFFPKVFGTDVNRDTEWKSFLINHKNKQCFICLYFRDMLMEEFLTTCHDMSWRTQSRCLRSQERVISAHETVPQTCMSWESPIQASNSTFATSTASQRPSFLQSHRWDILAASKLGENG